MNFKKLNCFFIMFAAVALNGCTKDTELISSEIRSSEVSEAKLSSDLVAWYTFNGDLKDHSGKGNDVVFNNAIPARGKNGKNNTAYKFNGTSSYMLVPNSSSLQGKAKQGITLVAVVQVDGFYQGECHGNRIFQKGEDKDYGAYFLGFDDQLYWGQQFNCFLPVENNSENFFGTVGNTQFDNAGSRGGESIRTGKWYTVIYSFDPQTHLSTLYINNKLVESNKNKTVSYRPNSKDLYIGRMENELFPYWFNGVIDEIRIYNSVLSPKEADFVYKSINY